MIDWQPDDRSAMAPAPRPEGNDTDLRYLEQTVAALEPFLAVCTTAARTGSAVRVLAGATLTDQAARLFIITAVLRDWGRPPTVGGAVVTAEALAGLQGEALDRVFIERLAAHTRASTAEARAEMIAGASRSARQIAEHAIHADDRQLAAIDALLAGTTVR